jgi:hypothetical protein
MTLAPLLSKPKRRLLLLAGCVLLLSGCSGIPLTSVPRLLQLSGQMLEADPGQIMVALQVDARLAPPPGAVPLMHIQLKPKVPGTFEAVDKKLPLAVATTGSAALGLAAPRTGRRWLIYSMPTATQDELRRIQAMVRQAKAQPGYQGGGTLSLEVEQKELVSTDPALARTAWSTWMRVKQNEGFFEVWNGTLQDIQKAAPAKS